MKPILSACVALIVLLGSPGHAQSVNCDQAVDQASLNSCSDQAYRASDQKLNAAYRTLTGRLKDADLKRLKAAQRSWITYRDAMCSFSAASSEGGSLHAMVVSDCLTRMTDLQTDLLISQGQCREGDVSCIGK